MPFWVMLVFILVILAVLTVLIIDSIHKTKYTPDRPPSELSQMAKRMMCAHIYDEVDDREFETQVQSNMNAAITNLYSYDVRCRHCGHRFRMSNADYDKHLRETKRLV